MNKEFSYKLKTSGFKITFFLLLLTSFIFQSTTFVLAAENNAIITELGSFPTGASAFEVVVIDNVAFVSDYYTGFFI